MTSYSPLLSIIIPNYNYEHYIGLTIDSALALDWPRKQIIVVDDGSTDRSLDVIRSYGDRLQVIEKSNGGQRSAVNAAFPLVEGELVYILDSDDIVYPHMARETIPHWNPQVAKVQFCLQIIDGDGANYGGVFPNYPPGVSHESIIRELLTTALYPCPPTSGNIYSKKALDHLFPIPEQEKFSSDSYLNTLSPLYGKVVCVNKTLASYRMHDKNSWGSAEFRPASFARMVRNDLAREAWLKERVKAEGAYEIDSVSLNEQSMLHMQYRMVSRRFAPENHPVAKDTVLGIMLKGLRACLRAPSARLSQRTVIILWYLGVGLMPHRLAWEMARVRFSPGNRPGLIQRFLQRTGALRRPGI
jgi:glycosyltransferase involved in cell wall biosynthesis